LSKINSLLRINQLSANIGRQRVLSNISFDVENGECVAIVGGSGAGKSCLLRCVMGLYKPALPFSGNLQFQQRYYDFSKVEEEDKVRSEIAFVPQNPRAGLDPIKPLVSQWKQALRCSNNAHISMAEQQSLLESLGLPWFDKAYPHQWSQGMQQRLLIAFALLAKPQLLILDEPTSALDSLIAAKTMTHIMAFARKNTIAVLIVTHDLALAARFAQRVAIMCQGEMLEFGNAEQILAAPQSDYGKLLVTNRHW
jgi:ABC-type glutathione transport system ATPase component